LEQGALERTTAMDDTVRRAERFVALMNERLCSRTPQERDRLMQQFIAQAMTPQQRFRAAGMLMNLAIKRRQLELKDEHGDQA
jgi:hypothetical protein